MDDVRHSASSLSAGPVVVRSADSTASRLQGRAWCVLGIVAALLIGHELLLQPVLLQLVTDGPVINLAGRQRMLSQRLAKAALALDQAQTAADRQRLRDELQSVMDEWSRTHRALQYGDSLLQLPPLRHADLQSAYQQLNPLVDTILQAAEALLLARDTDRQSASLADAREQILLHEADYLTQMQQIVELHQSRAQAHVSHLQKLGWGIVSVILLLLLAIQAFFIRPAVRTVGHRLLLWELQYQRLVESMSEGLVVHDANGIILLTNSSFGRLVGRHPDDLIGQSLRKVLKSEEYSTYLARLPAEGEPCEGVELTLRTRDGDLLETAASLCRLLDQEYQSPSFLVVVTDVTAQRRTARQNRELQSQLAHAARLTSIGEMAAGLAHELNQPLAAIANFAEAGLAAIQNQSATPASLQVPLQRVLSAALRGGEIVRRTRRYAQRSAGESRPQSINALIAEVEQLFRFEVQRHRVELDVVLDPLVPPVVLDGLQFQQVLSNLLQNALNVLAGEAGERRVRIHSEVMQPAAVRISVSDNGTGLNGLDPQQLFQPFFTTQPQGLGLGLAIAQSLVEQQGGTIEALDLGLDGRGATFRFTLPVGPLPVSSAPVRGEPTGVPSPGEVLHV